MLRNYYNPVVPKILNKTPHVINIINKDCCFYDRMSKKHRLIKDVSAEKATIQKIPISGGEALHVRGNLIPYVVYNLNGIEISANNLLVTNRIDFLPDYTSYDIIIVSEYYANAVASVGYCWDYLDRLYIVDSPVLDDNDNVIGCLRLRHYFPFLDAVYYDNNCNMSAFSSMLAHNMQYGMYGFYPNMVMNFS